MPEIMRQADRFDKILVDKIFIVKDFFLLRVKIAADGPSDLRDFDRVCEAGSVKIIFTGEKNLRFSLKASEFRRMNYPVAVDLERGSVVAPAVARL
jgi:hypothetical protein